MKVLLLEQEKILRCNLVSPNFPSERLVKSISPQVLVAVSLHKPRKYGVLYICCLKPHEGSVNLPKGCTVGALPASDEVEVRSGKSEMDVNG